MEWYLSWREKIINREDLFYREIKLYVQKKIQLYLCKFKSCKSTDHELSFQVIDLLLPVLQLLFGLIRLKLGLCLQLVKWILQLPMMLQELLPLQPWGRDERRPLKDRATTEGGTGSSGLIAALVLTGLCQVEAACSSDCWRAGPSLSAAHSGSGSAHSWLWRAPCRMTAAPHGGHGSPSWVLLKRQENKFVATLEALTHNLHQKRPRCVRWAAWKVLHALSHQTCFWAVGVTPSFI